MADPQYPICQAADPNPKKPNFRAPGGATDTHAHVFGPESDYPYSPRRGYTPPDAPLAAYEHLHETLGIERGVLTQPSVYGTDNQAMLDAMAKSGGRLRGVASVDATATEADLARLNAAGVRGLRINLADKGGNPFGSFSEVQKMSERVKEMGWHLEFLLHVHEFDDLKASFSSLAVDSVFGHMGYMPAALGAGHPAFQEFLGLVQEGRAWVKLTGAYRITGKEHTPYDDVDPIAQALIEARPERMLWGSDWPHPICKIPMPNDGDLLDQLAAWAPGEDERKQILADNPEKLYGFRNS